MFMRKGSKYRLVHMRFQSFYAVTFLIGYFALATSAMADRIPADPVELMIKFDADGQFLAFDPGTGRTTYDITAVGTAPVVKKDGRIKARNKDKDTDQDVLIKGAQITFDPFDPLNPPPIINFNCKGCNLTFPDGSTLESDTNNVPLNGRALFVYGPVAPDPVKPIATIRMMGCAGLRETSGQGKYANKVGSICFNGVFNFDVSDPTTIPATLTGSSSCTIVLHSPVVSLPPMN